MKSLPAWVEVDLQALGANIRAVQQRIGPTCKILMIVKADAYGHGSVEVAREAVRNGVYMLGVATVDEGKELRAAGIDAAILVLSPAMPEEIPSLLDAELRATIPDLDFALQLSQHAQRAGKWVPVHVEIDTGMGRSGCLDSLAVPWLQQISTLPGVLLEGLYTHFPVSDTDVATTAEQCQRFGALVARLRQSGVRIPLVHPSNSAGVLQVHEAHLDMVRPGGVLYGCMPDPTMQHPADVQRVMSFHARLVQVRPLPPRTPISYGSDVFTRDDIVMGVVPVGYGHGLSRAYSGSGVMLFRGRRVPILGRVTMDMTMLDLSGFDSPRVGEEVVVFGRQNGAEITVEEVASRVGVIGYEILCGISKRVVRVYRRGNDVESMRGLTGTRSVSNAR